MHTHPNVRLVASAECGYCICTLTSTTTRKTCCPGVDQPGQRLQLSRSIQVERCNGTAGSTLRSRYPAADAQTSATSARSESQVPKLHRQEDCDRHWPPLSSVEKAMKAVGRGRLRYLERKTLAQRYKWEKPGDMIYVDTKELATFERVGYCITGDHR
jgi:hypothetical protein